MTTSAYCEIHFNAVPDGVAPLRRNVLQALDGDCAGQRFSVPSSCPQLIAALNGESDDGGSMLDFYNCGNCPTRNCQFHPADFYGSRA